MKRLMIVLVAAANSITCTGQKLVREFKPENLKSHCLQWLEKEYGLKKTTPVQYRQQILIALSFFPELKNIEIEFRIRQTCKAPLTTAPALSSLLASKKNRRYIITIRNLRSKTLQPILFENLSYNAQIGVIGHELSHVADFNTQSLLQLVKGGVQHLSYKYVDRFEYNTDSICIAHGLGYQLLAWSQYVRTSLHRTNWIGAANAAKEAKSQRERYMNPKTILRKIHERS